MTTPARLTVDEFHARLKAQGVPTREDLAFKCPCCSTVQTIGDLMDIGQDRETAERNIGFNCIGRFNGAGPATRECKPRPGKTGCDWSLGGLLSIHNIEIVDAEGKTHPYFDICEPDEAQAHALKRVARKAGGVAA